MGTLLLSLLVWSVLVSGAGLAPMVGGHVALLGTSCVALAILIAARPASVGREAAPAHTRRVLAVSLAGLAGFVAFPAWLGLAITLGSGLGFEPGDATPPIEWSGAVAAPVLWVVHLGIAPALEELWFRERLLSALRPRCGAVGAIVATSALFGLAHGDAWHAVGAFCVGLWLGAVFQRSGSLGWCIAYHAGLNAAALLGGVPPPSPLLSLESSLLIGAALTLTGLWLIRPGPATAATVASAARA